MEVKSNREFFDTVYTDICTMISKRNTSLSKLNNKFILFNIERDDFIVKSSIFEFGYGKGMFSTDILVYIEEGKVKSIYVPLRVSPRDGVTTKIINGFHLILERSSI